MAAGLLATAALWFAAPAIAAFYDKPALTTIIHVLSFVIVINAAGAVHVALLTKRLDFLTQMKIGAIANLVSGTTAITLAWQGFGVWALVAQILFSTLLGNMLLFKAGEKQPLIPLILMLVATGLVSALGYFGGDIVFGGAKSAAVAPPAAAGTTSTNAEGFSQLTQDGYTLAWKIHDNAIDVKVSYKTNGWVGFGIGKTGTMEGSHIILGFVLDGKATVADHFGYAHDKHGPQEKVGGKDSLTARDGKFADGTTTISFTMPLNTGNP